jgi:hypothetical protein
MRIKKFNEGLYPTRSFIDETIEILEDSAIEIKRIWTKFKNGEITKSEFEKQYIHVLRDWLEEAYDEGHRPNNGCKYKDTNPDCKFFTDSDI